MGLINTISQSVIDAWDTTFGGILGLLGGAGDLFEKLKDNTPQIINVTQGLKKGHVIAPKDTTDTFIYFVRPVKDGYNYVCGYMADEFENIIKTISEPFSYVIFVPSNLHEYGIPHIASGKEIYKEYGGNDAEKLRKIVEKDIKHTYLATDKDVEFLSLRLKIMGIGKVCTRTEIINLINLYNTTKGCCTTADDEKIIYQCLMDTAIASIQ